MPQDFDAVPPPGQISVLVVSPDDPAKSPVTRVLSEGRETWVVWERNLRHARSVLAGTRFDVVVAAADLPDGEGLSLVADRNSPRQRWATILLGDGLDAAEIEWALRQGVVEVVDRDDAPERMADALRRARSRRAGTKPGAKPATAAERRATGTDPELSLLGDSPTMRTLRQRLQRIAPAPVDVLVIGETGCGKDLVARSIHAASARRGAFVALNCGAIPEQLFESELFGHEAGAFTGAGKGRIGLLEQSDGGTLFLDEIESLPLGQQVKLLRVLENRCIGRLGGRGERPLDLRIVAAAQRPLGDLCGKGLFRADLWHRLNVVSVWVPPLRDRLEDLATLFGHFIEDAARRFGVPAAPPGDALLAQLACHTWPGNVRELRHTAERHVLGLPLWSEDERVGSPTSCLAVQLSRVEREVIRAALARHGLHSGPSGPVLRAAASELGVSPKTLTRRMAALGLGRQQS